MSGTPAPAPDPRAPGLLVGEGALIPQDAVLGANVVVHAGTVLGAGCTIGDHAVLGKAPMLSPHSRAHGEAGPLVLEDGVRVGAGAVLFAGARVCTGAIIGDQAYVRERAHIGERSLVGRGSAVDNDVVVGARVRIQTSVYLTAFSEVEDDVFIGPGATTTNDDTMARHEPGATLRGALLRRACRVGAAAVLTPGVEIGEEAFVAAGAVVTRDVPARTRVIGVPARAAGQVGEDELLERWR